MKAPFESIKNNSAGKMPAFHVSFYMCVWVCVGVSVYDWLRWVRFIDAQRYIWLFLQVVHFVTNWVSWIKGYTKIELVGPPKKFQLFLPTFSEVGVFSLLIFLLRNYLNFFIQ